MSDRKSAANKPDSPSPAPSVRRISNPRPKKAPNKPAAAPSVEAEPAPPAIAGGGDIELVAPLVEVAPSAAEASQAAVADWPEPEASTNGGQASADGKRKRRRRKGKGQSGNAQGASGREESQGSNDGAESQPGELPKPLRAPQPPPAPRQQASRVKIDPETLARKAWKIFLAEVSEEGVALIGDQDARELARRCFRLAELFIEEQSRHFPGGA